MKQLFFASLLSIFWSGPIWADQITGQVVFDKRVPEAGLIYVAGESSSIPDAEIDQKDKMFTSKIVLADSKSPFTFKNSDTYDHNIFARDTDAGAVFDVGLMSSGSEEKIDVNWAKDTLVKIGCKIHPRMRAYIANIDASQHQIIEFNKEQQSYDFSLSDVPDNVKKLVVLLPGFDPLEILLSEKSGQTVEILRRGKRRGEIKVNQLTRKGAN